MSDKISVIVPVYKVEKYLNRCVQSIASQTYENLEIILVDDGSPDNCGVLCDEWVQKDSRIKVVHKENGGLSSARNAGVAVATGAYVGFVDSDDYIHPQMYEKLYEALVENGADISICGCDYVDEELIFMNEAFLKLKHIKEPAGIQFIPRSHIKRVTIFNIADDTVRLFSGQNFFFQR